MKITYNSIFSFKSSAIFLRIPHNILATLKLQVINSFVCGLLFWTLKNAWKAKIKTYSYTLKLILALLSFLKYMSNILKLFQR